MRLLSFRPLDAPKGGAPKRGALKFGAVVDGGIADLSARLEGSWPSLRAAIGGKAWPQLAAAARGAPADFKLTEVEFAPTIPDPAKIICVGLNYSSHVGEMGRELPKVPSLFSRLHDTLIGHGAPMVRPRASTHFDFEGELAVVIGESCRAVPRARALSVVAGYSCFVDGSVRDFQKHSVTAGKNFPSTGPLGPWLATVDEIPDPQALSLTTRLNGNVVQKDTTGHMIFDVATIIEYVSTFTPLSPGDVIATGTPDGVGAGRKPPLWMKAGDKLDVEISSIGTLSTHVVDE